ncbi:MAG: hypothetical protein ACI93P_002726 [bacterium]|jgi:hypothetical protein
MPLGYDHDGDYSNFEVLQYLSPLSLYNSWGRFKYIYYYYILIPYIVLGICYDVINADSFSIIGSSKIFGLDIIAIEAYINKDVGI